MIPEIIKEWKKLEIVGHKKTEKGAGVGPV